MAELIAGSRRYNIAPSLAIRPFDALAESIAYQQLSGKAAATIWGRVRALYPKKNISIQNWYWRRRTENCALPVCPAARLRR